jgi:hypothetical protein
MYGDIKLSYIVVRRSKRNKNFARNYCISTSGYSDSGTQIPEKNFRNIFTKASFSRLDVPYQKHPPPPPPRAISFMKIHLQEQIKLFAAIWFG